MVCLMIDYYVEADVTYDLCGTKLQACRSQLSVGPDGAVRLSEPLGYEQAGWSTSVVIGARRGLNHMVTKHLCRPCTASLVESSG